jgi:CheY-like chemotaxis protein
MRKLYVVDDDVGFLEIVREVATPIGFNVVSAGGPDAFKSAYGGESDSVVMMDLVMPGTDGIELLGWLCGQARPVAVILMSGYNLLYMNNASALAEAKGMKVTAKLTKPVKLAELRTTLTAVKDVPARRR